MSGMLPVEQPSRGTILMNYGLTKTRVRLVSGAAILALSAGTAMAQETVEQVVVSSTRLQNAGFDAPTPTTVVSAADLQAQAKPSVFDAITELPALQGSTGGLSTNGDAGNTRFQAAAGTSFAGGRGHFEIAGEYAYNDGLLPRYPVETQHTAQPNIGGRTLARQSGQMSYSSDAATPAGQ